MLYGCATTPGSTAGGKPSHYTELGVGYLQKGRLDQAALNFEKALQAGDTSADVHHYYALLQERLGKRDKAAEHFAKALQVTPAAPALLNNYGSFLCGGGQYEAAERAFLDAVKDPLYPTPEFAYTNAGICVRKAGKVAQAEEYFRKALERNNRFAEALYQMAKLNYEKGRYNKAEAFLYRYNENAPPSPESLLLCYRLQTRLNDTKKAESCAVQLRSRFPDSAAASEID